MTSQNDFDLSGDLRAHPFGELLVEMASAKYPFGETAFCETYRNRFIVTDINIIYKYFTNLNLILKILNKN